MLALANARRVRPLSSPLAGGSCGIACGAAQQCKTGVCTVGCPTDTTLCNGVCADLTWDNNNCEWPASD